MHSFASDYLDLPWFAVSHIVNLGIEKSLIEILFEEGPGMNVCWVRWLDLKTLPKLIFFNGNHHEVDLLILECLRFFSSFFIMKGACLFRTLRFVVLFRFANRFNTSGDDRRCSLPLKPNSFLISPCFTCNLDITSSVWKCNGIWTFSFYPLNCKCRQKRRMLFGVSQFNCLCIIFRYDVL